MASAQSNWLSLEDALTQTLSLTSQIVETETLALSDALSRVTGIDILASSNIPPWDNSSMDGYAVRCEDLSTSSSLPVAATVFAGASDVAPLESGTAARIMTGAPVPQGADTVIIQENVNRENDSITPAILPSRGDNIRVCGSDISQGECVVAKGTRLTPSHLMLLASLGITEVCVYRKLKVGLMATGDELCPPGENLGSGQIYESNSTGISALLSEFAVEIINYGIVKDDVGSLTSTIKEAASEVDILITSGGVSVGDADHVKPVVESLGSVDFWKVAIKPGKPFAFGRVDNMIFCGVPGNPVSAYVTTQMLVIPVIERLQGIHQLTAPLRMPARLAAPLSRRAGRTDFQRATMWQETGEWHVKPLSKQSSGVMSSVTQANCYLVLPAQQAEFSAGERVTVVPFSQRMATENTE